MAPKKKSPSSKDLRPRAVKPAKAAAIRGGGKNKVSVQDLHITKVVDKTTP